MEEAMEIHKITKVNGIMSARGLLKNPALFLGPEQTPIECIDKFLEYSLDYGSSTKTIHHHMLEMLESILPKKDLREFQDISCISGIIDFWNEWTNKKSSVGK
jgi:tRNA-dihydrouridine synthase 4